MMYIQLNKFNESIILVVDICIVDVNGKVSGLWAEGPVSAAGRRRLVSDYLNYTTISSRRLLPRGSEEG